jgi:N6-adenosine-specific RNA methylase IME4
LDRGSGGIYKMNIKINEEFKRLIPPLEEDEYQQLESSIKKEGVREPLVLWGDVLVDGHNRKEIADKLKVKYQTSQKQFKDKNEVILWMIDNQLGRRNISKYDRTRLNLKKEDILRPIAKAISLSNLKQNSSDVKKSEPRGRVVEQIAKASKVSHDTVTKVKYIEQKADEKQKEDLSLQKFSINKIYTELKKAENRKRIAETFKEPPLPRKHKKYNIIYADPPWSFKHYSDKGKGRAPDNYYKCQNLEDIKKLPISNISADDCVLFMWVTYPFLEKSFEVLKAWGFTYKTVGFTWVKKNKKSDGWFWGMGYWTRSNAEICIIATKGSITRQSSSVHQIIESPIEEHSKKPDITRDKIIELVGDLPRIELFARQASKGWDVWGNEVK